MVGCGLQLGGLLGSGGLAWVSGRAEGVACGWWRHHALEGAGVAQNGELERKIEKHLTFLLEAKNRYSRGKLCGLVFSLIDTDALRQS